MDRREQVRWARFNSVGGISEVTILAPIKRGRVPGERRTYEQRVRERIDTIQARTNNHLPSSLSKVQSIHFGRIAVLRPEQYLSSSHIPDCVEYEEFGTTPSNDAESSGYQNNYPKPIDVFHEKARFIDETTARENDGERHLPSLLLVLVEFDGDPAVYFRDIAERVADDFDKVLDNCVNFPGTVKFEAFWRWIRRYQIEADLFLPIYRDLSTVRIKALQNFRARFDEFAARVRSSRAAGNASIDELFDDFLRETEQAGDGYPFDSGLFAETEEED